MAAEVARYWRHEAVDGVDLLRARFVTHRYGRHAHETYTFGLIEAGVEEFEYGGSLLRASAGAVALLDPDVVHTGQAATPAGWSYRVLYPQVSVVTDVAAELGWPAGTPRFPQTVLDDPATATLLRSGAPGGRARRPARVVDAAAQHAGRPAARARGGRPGRCSRSGSPRHPPLSAPSATCCPNGSPTRRRWPSWPR